MKLLRNILLASLAIVSGVSARMEQKADSAFIKKIKRFLHIAPKDAKPITNPTRTATIGYHHATAGKKGTIICSLYNTDGQELVAIRFNPKAKAPQKLRQKRVLSDGEQVLVEKFRPQAREDAEQYQHSRK